MSYGFEDGSDIRARLVKGFDHYHEVALRSDRDVAQLMCELGIHIAIELKGYTEKARPGILAYRPAPIQVSYLGYPASMGIDFIDYILADPMVLPMDQQAYYSEKIVHLPGGYWPSDSKRLVAEGTPSRHALGLPEIGFVFCCFNNTYKITPEVFDRWMVILRKIDSSVLWLLDTGELAKRNLRSEAHRKGELVGIPIAADDPQALDVAARLVRDAGFEPVVVGPLAKAKLFDVGSPVYTQLLTARELRERLGK